MLLDVEDYRYEPNSLRNCDRIDIITVSAKQLSAK